jgi:hypothetical protein
VYDSWCAVKYSFSTLALGLSVMVAKAEQRQRELDDALDRAAR